MRAATPIAIQTPALDVDCILAWILGIERPSIFSHPEAEIAPDEAETFFSAVEKRLTGLPVAYIVGKKEFYGRDFFVSPAVLIPKPDTEILVERGLGILFKLIASRTAVSVADVCTGSGCVAISLWKELQGRGGEEKVRFLATDISSEALAVAEKNCIRHGCTIEFVQEDLLGRWKDGEFDLVISNPPYVPSAVAKKLLEDGRTEPLLALDGDRDGSSDGTGLIARLLPQTFSVLRPGGFILLETGEYNAATTAVKMEETGFVEIKIHQDLAGMPRVVEGRKAP